MPNILQHIEKRAVALVLPLPDPEVPEQHEKCCILCKKTPEWKFNSIHHLRCRLHHYYKPKADCILLSRRDWNEEERIRGKCDFPAVNTCSNCSRLTQDDRELFRSWCNLCIHSLLNISQPLRVICLKTFPLSLFLIASCSTTTLPWSYKIQSNYLLKRVLQAQKQVVAYFPSFKTFRLFECN